MPCTTTGTIVYKRKRHPFSWRDVRRIVLQLESAPDFVTREALRARLGPDPALGELREALEAAQAKISRLESELALCQESAEPRAFPGFSGGEFGGAGASGSFDRNLSQSPGTGGRGVSPNRGQNVEEEEDPDA